MYHTGLRKDNMDKKQYYIGQILNNPILLDKFSGDPEMLAIMINIVVDRIIEKGG